MYVRFPLSLRNVEGLLCERGIDISHETVRFWWKWWPLFEGFRALAYEILTRRNPRARRDGLWRFMFWDVGAAGWSSTGDHVDEV